MCSCSSKLILMLMLNIDDGIRADNELSVCVGPDVDLDADMDVDDELSVCVGIGT